MARLKSQPRDLVGDDAVFTPPSSTQSLGQKSPLYLSRACHGRFSQDEALRVSFRLLAGSTTYGHMRTQSRG